MDAAGGCRGIPGGRDGRPADPGPVAVVAAIVAEGGHFQLYELDGKAGVAWRLLSANNRELGWGTAGYPSAGECVAAIQDMIVAR